VHGLRLNSLQNFDRLKTAEDRFVVTPNNLTIDSYGIVDVSRGPVVTYVPHFREPRWFIVQLGDAFDDVVFNVGGTKAPMPGAYLVTGPDFSGRIPGEMTGVRLRTNLGFVALRIAVTGSADLPDAVREQAGFRLVPLFDRLGAAMSYILPTSADVNDTFVQALATNGFDWQALDESVLAGLRRAAPIVEQIIDERWQSMSETVNGWRGSLASGRCSYDWSLNAANAKN
jgi:hypothetical protein